MSLNGLGGDAGRYLIGLTQHGQTVINAAENTVAEVIKPSKGGIFSTILNVGKQALSYMGNHKAETAIAFTAIALTTALLGYGAHKAYKKYKASREQEPMNSVDHLPISQSNVNLLGRSSEIGTEEVVEEDEEGESVEGENNPQGVGIGVPMHHLVQDADVQSDGQPE